jgi:nickel-dependent lactate racemase
MEEQIVYGEKMIPVKLPENVQAAPQSLSTSLPPVDDIEAEIRAALQQPLGRPPLGETVRPNWKVTIAFDDPTVPCFAAVWEPAIKLVIEELEKGGVKRSNIGESVPGCVEPHPSSNPQRNLGSYFTQLQRSV